jgi:hypothetical protein
VDDKGGPGQMMATSHIDINTTITITDPAADGLYPWKTDVVIRAMQMACEYAKKMLKKEGLLKENAQYPYSVDVRVTGMGMRIWRESSKEKKNGR